MTDRELQEEAAWVDNRLKYLQEGEDEAGKRIHKYDRRIDKLQSLHSKNLAAYEVSCEKRASYSRDLLNHMYRDKRQWKAWNERLTYHKDRAKTMLAILKRLEKDIDTQRDRLRVVENAANRKAERVADLTQRLKEVKAEQRFRAGSTGSDRRNHDNRNYRSDGPASGNRSRSNSVVSGGSYYTESYRSDSIASGNRSRSSSVASGDSYYSESRSDPVSGSASRSSSTGSAQHTNRYSNVPQMVNPHRQLASGWPNTNSARSLPGLPPFTVPGQHAESRYARQSTMYAPAASGSQPYQQAPTSVNTAHNRGREPIDPRQYIRQPNNSNMNSGPTLYSTRYF